MTVCAINGCHNASDKKNKDCKITFHIFPSDPIIAARWTEKIRLNRNESWWKPSKSTKICSVHFNDTEKYITEGGLCRLRRNAVPSKNMPFFCTEISSNEISQECHMPEESQPGTSDTNNSGLNSPTISVSSSLFDSPKEASLRRKLRKSILIQRKQEKKIKTLLQAIRRLSKKNTSMQQIVQNLLKEKIKAKNS